MKVNGIRKASMDKFARLRVSSNPSEKHSEDDLNDAWMCPEQAPMTTMGRAQTQPTHPNAPLSIEPCLLISKLQGLVNTNKSPLYCFELLVVFGDVSVGSFGR